MHSYLSTPDFNYTLNLEEVPYVPRYIPRAFPIENAFEIILYNPQESVKILGNAIKEATDISIGNESYFGLYTGTTKDGKRHGKGTLELKNFEIFKGDWEDGDFSGFGTI